MNVYNENKAQLSKYRFIMQRTCLEEMAVLPQ